MSIEVNGMYLQFREMAYEGEFTRELEDWLYRIRKSLTNSKWTICWVKQPSPPVRFGIVLLDLPKVPWYMSGNPMMCLMANELYEKHLPRLKKALERHKAPEGTYRVSNLGVDHSNLLKDEYDWLGSHHRRKVEAFVKRVERGDYVDKKGSPCDTCVDEAQFMGCHGCDWNEDDYEDEEEGYHYDPYEDSPP